MSGHRARLSAFLAILVAGAGCITVNGARDGAVVDESMLGRLVRGRSGRKDVTEILGPPSLRAQSGGREAWFYEYEDESLVVLVFPWIWAERRRTTYRLEFDRGGVLEEVKRLEPCP